MQDLIQQYRESLAWVRRAKAKATDENDRTLLSNMETGLVYALEWMETGRRPGNRRGIERRAAYQRERPIDPIHFQRYAFQQAFQQPECTVSDSDMWRVHYALSTLTKLEREVYMMKVGQGLTAEQVGSHMGMAASTVRVLIHRAEKKMMKHRQSKQGDLFSGVI